MARYVNVLRKSEPSLQTPLWIFVDLTFLTLMRCAHDNGADGLLRSSLWLPKATHGAPSDWSTALAWCKTSPPA